MPRKKKEEINVDLQSEEKKRFREVPLFVIPKREKEAKNDIGNINKKETNNLCE